MAEILAHEIPRHRCETCGFLALRNRLSGLLDEAPQEYRWQAEIPTVRRANQPPVRSMLEAWAQSDLEFPYTGVPICLVRAHPLHNEFANQDHAEEAEIFGMLTRDRSDCASRGLFTSWHQGFTPKEHREMLDRERMLQWEAKQKASDRKWRVVELLVFILAGAATAIIAALVERGSIP
jgi:hypothetical protein